MPEIVLAEGVRSVPRDAWNRLVGEGSPFLEWEFLASLEDAGCVGPETGWLPRPLLLQEGARLLAACPLYVKGHSEGEFVFDWSWADAAQRAGIVYYPKLLVGVPFTPVTGARLLVAPPEDGAPDAGAVHATLADALRDLCRANRLSSAHVNFCTGEERLALERAGFVPRLGVQYHWRNDGYRDFEDFLTRFRSKRRNQIHRERRVLAEAGVRIRAFAGDAIPDDVFPRLFPLYLTTVERNPWGRQYLNARFFALLRERFRHRLVIVLAHQGEELVGGTINVQKGDALYGRYWGAFRELRDLHFGVCYYAAVEHCIAQGLARFEPGAGGDYKQVRGFDATPTWSAHFVADPRLRAAVERALEGERAHVAREIDWLHAHSALKPAER
jgi:hypothetical protein